MKEQMLKVWPNCKGDVFRLARLLDLLVLATERATLLGRGVVVYSLEDRKGNVYKLALLDGADTISV